MNHSVRITLLFSLFWAAAAGADTPAGWRTDGTGRYPAATPATKWSATENVIWKTPMPGRSNSTPVIAGDRFFVCSERTTLVCVNLADGKILWQKTNDYADAMTPEQRLTLKENLPPAHDVNGYSSPTPVTNGRNVYVLFGTGTVACYDLDGNRKWIKFVEKAEKTTENWGHSSSPLLVGDNLVVHIVDLVALNAETGEVRWRQTCQASLGSPAYAKVGDTDVVITPQGDIFKMADGSVLARGAATLEFCTPVIQDGVAYFIEHGGKAVKLPDRTAPEFKPQVLWETKPAKERYFASPVCHDGLIYAIQQRSLLSVIDAATGQVVYEQKLNMDGTVFTSPAFAGGHVFASDERGMTVVFKPGRKYEEVSRNSLEPLRSSPVFAGKRMYVRGLQNLYCIGQ